MTEPVVVNGRNYDRSAIVELVVRTGRDIKGDEVKLDDPRQFNPSTNDIKRICRKALRMNEANKGYSLS